MVTVEGEDKGRDGAGTFRLFFEALDLRGLVLTDGKLFISTGDNTREKIQVKVAVPIRRRQRQRNSEGRNHAHLARFGTATLLLAI